MPVNTSETPECGKSVSPRKLRTVLGERVIAAPANAPRYFPAARARIYTAVNTPAPRMRRKSSGMPRFRMTAIMANVRTGENPAVISCSFSSETILENTAENAMPMSI